MITTLLLTCKTLIVIRRSPVSDQETVFHWDDYQENTRQSSQKKTIEYRIEMAAKKSWMYSKLNSKRSTLSILSVKNGHDLHEKRIALILCVFLFQVRLLWFDFKTWKSGWLVCFKGSVILIESCRWSLFANKETNPVNFWGQTHFLWSILCCPLSRIRINCLQRQNINFAFILLFIILLRRKKTSSKIGIFQTIQEGQIAL